MSGAGLEEAKAAPPVFLERHSYRRRRLSDAARLFPILGAALFLVPLLWPAGAGAEGVRMSQAIIYVFGAWAALIVLTGVFGYSMRRWGQAADTADTPRAD